MNRPKRKKIYYVPGIISLIILPFVFYSFADKQLKRKSQTVIPLTCADPAYYKRLAGMLPANDYSFPPRRNYLDISFTGDYTNDKIKLDFAQTRVREILSQNDGMDGIHFHYCSNSTYGTFVKTINVLNIEDAKTYLSYENDLWFYHFPPDTTVKILPFDCLLCNDVVVVPPEISRWSIIKQWAKRIGMGSWMLIAGFTSLFAAGFISRRLYDSSHSRDASR